MSVVENVRKLLYCNKKAVVTWGVTVRDCYGFKFRLKYYIFWRDISRR